MTRRLLYSFTEDEIGKVIEAAFRAMIREVDRLGGGGLSAGNLYDFYGAVDDAIIREWRRAKRRVRKLVAAGEMCE